MWNFGSSLVRNTVLIYLPDGTNIYGARGGDWGVSGDRVSAQG